MRGQATAVGPPELGQRDELAQRRSPALAGRWTVWVLGLTASLPIVVSVIDVLSAGWVPLADDAMIAISAFDVLTGNSSLLGAWSSGYTDLNGENTFHPGPLLFWLLALPTRVLDPGSMQVTAGLVNVASVIGTVALARRRGGAGLMVATAVAIPVMLASLPAESYSDIWNPSAPLLPFMALLMLSWSVACGEYRLLPATVAVASFVPQCHLAFLVPTLAAVAVAAAGLALSLRSGTGDPRGGRPRTWLLAALAVGLLCWSAPLVDQAVNRPGNLALIFEAATTDKATLGLDQAWRAVVHTVGVSPWWLGDPQVGLARVVDLTIRPGAGTIASAGLMLLALAALLPIGLRCGRGDVATAALLGLGLAASAALVTYSTPENSFSTLGYGLRWASPAGMWIWLVLAWSGLTLARGSGAAQRLRAGLLATVPRPALVALVLLAVAVPAILAATSGELKDEPYDDMQAFSDRVLAELGQDEASRVDLASTPDSSFMALNLGSGMVYALRRSGRPVTAPVFANYIGPEYDQEGTPPRRIVRIDVNRPPPTGAQVVARAGVLDAPDPGEALRPDKAPIRRVTVSLAAPTSSR